MRQDDLRLASLPPLGSVPLGAGCRSAASLRAPRHTALQDRLRRFILCTLVMALAAIDATPAQTWHKRPETWYEYYENAQTALKKRNWTQALEQLNRAIEKRAEPGVAVRTFGMNFVNYHPYLKLGIVYYNLGEHDAALQAFDTESRFGAIGRLIGDSPSAEMRNLETFREFAQKAKEASQTSEPERVAAVVTRTLQEAEILERQGRLEEGMSVLSKALAVAPDHPQATAAMERLRLLLDKQENERALTERITALVNEGNQLVAAGNYQDASSRFKQALSRRPSDAIQSFLDDSQGKLRTQLESETAARQSVLMAEAFAEAGQLERAGRESEAIEKLQFVLALDPEHEQAQSMERRLFAAQADGERARLRSVQVEEFLAESATLINGGLYERAVATLHRAMSLDPANIAARGQLQEAFQRLNNKILKGAPIRSKIPPTVILTNQTDAIRDEGALGQGDSPSLVAEEHVASTAFMLSGIVLDDQPEVLIVYVRTQVDANGAETEHALPGEALVGTHVADMGYSFTFSRSFQLDPGLSAWRIVVTDSDGLTSEVLHRVLYQPPWFLSPMPYVAVLASILLTVLLYQISLARRRHRMRKRLFNPYIAGAPVLQNNMFFGRQRLMNRVLQTVHNNSLLLYGERRIGKTSFQHHLKKRLEEVNDPEHHFYPVYIDLQGTPEEEFFLTLADGIFDGLATLEPLRADSHMAERPYSYQNFTADLRRILRHLKDQTRKQAKLVLLIDEVDELNNYDPKINQRLRSLFMKNFSENLVAVVSGVAIKKQWESEGSPWYNFFEEIQVKPFRHKDAEELITRPIRGIFKIDKSVVNRIISKSDGRPYYIQRFCVALVNRLHVEKRRRITSEDVDFVGRQLEG